MSASGRKRNSKSSARTRCWCGRSFGLVLSAWLSLCTLILLPGTSSGGEPKPTARDAVKKGTIEAGLMVGHWQAVTFLSSDFTGETDSVNRAAVYFLPQLGRVMTNELGSGYWSGHVVLYGELLLAHYYHPFSASAFGATLNLKYDFVSFGRWMPFVEVGFGPMWTDLAPRLEQQSSQFNLATQLGPGVQYFMTDRHALTLGVRWHHISSAGIGDQNTGLNAVLAYIGLSLYFPKETP